MCGDRVLADALFDDVGDVLHGRAQLLHAVVAQGDIVGELRLVAQYVHGLGEFTPCPLVISFLVHDCTNAHNCVGVVRETLVEMSFAAGQVVLLIFNRGLQVQFSLPIRLILD